MPSNFAEVNNNLIDQGSPIYGALDETSFGAQRQFAAVFVVGKRKLTASNGMQKNDCLNSIQKS